MVVVIVVSCSAESRSDGIKVQKPSSFFACACTCHAARSLVCEVKIAIKIMIDASAGLRYVVCGCNTTTVILKAVEIIEFK